MSVKLRFLALALGACMAVVPLAEADEAADPEFQSGFRVYVDPETGQLVSTPVTEEQRAAAAADRVFAQDSRAVIEAIAVDGSPMYILNGQFELALGAQVDPDGTRRYNCGDAAHVGMLPAAHAEAHAAAAVRSDR